MSKERKIEAASEAEAPQEQNQLTPQQAVEIIYKALESGQKAGAYSLQEARTILTVFEGVAKAILPKEEK